MLQKAGLLIVKLEPKMEEGGLSNQHVISVRKQTVL